MREINNPTNAITMTRIANPPNSYEILWPRHPVV